MSISKTLWVLILLVAITAAIVGTRQSTAQNISPEQMEQLNNLTPAQRQQILQAVGGPVSSSTRNQPLQETGPTVIANVPTAVAEVEADDRLAPLDSIVLELSIVPDSKLRPEEIGVALGRNLLQLDAQGYLRVPGAGSVLVAGLTTAEAQLRLSAETVFDNLEVNIYRLPINQVGIAALRRFGYELFAGTPTTFAPATDIPVPVDYTVGPGDVISLLLFGQQNAEYQLIIGRDGRINIPEIGPVAVAGMRFDQLREELTKRIEERYIGVNISVTMGELRSIRVFVLGDVNQPGSYTVSSLSTMTNALFVSGGIAASGSMRGIQLKRQNRVVGSLDLYELLLKGNTRADRRLQPGDVIYVPPVGEQVSIYGHVNRPAVYEMRGATDLSAVVAMAGGLLPSAFRQRVPIERFSENGTKTVLIADLDAPAKQAIKSGDQVRILGALEEIRNGVFLRGHVKREGPTRWWSGIKLLDIIPDPEAFQLHADQSYVLVRRVSRDQGRMTLLSSDWRAAYDNPSSKHNLAMNAGDVIYVYSNSGNRANRIQPLIAELESQATDKFPAETVVVQGWVRAPGQYPYEPSMRVSDLVRAAGSTREFAYLDEAELTRLTETETGRATVHLPVNLAKTVAGGADDLLLQPDDVLTIKSIPLWRERQRVEISGEIEFPGMYTVSRGERISELVRRAGGPTDLAFVGGSVFLREDLKERESIQLAKLQKRLRSEIAAFADVQNESRERANSLLEQLSTTEAVGRLVIDLNLALLGDPEHDVVLEEGDRLIIPARSQEVTVIGEVQYPTSHIFQSKQDQFSYIYKSGGVTPNADNRRIYVIRADGNVVAQLGSNWYRRSGRAIEIRPGDTIVVPFDADRISRLTLWSSVSQIIYNIGVSAAAVASF